MKTRSEKLTLQNKPAILLGVTQGRIEIKRTRVRRNKSIIAAMIYGSKPFYCKKLKRLGMKGVEL